MRCLPHGASHSRRDTRAAISRSLPLRRPVRQNIPRLSSVGVWSAHATPFQHRHYGGQPPPSSHLGRIPGFKPNYAGTKPVGGLRLAVPARSRAKLRSNKSSGPASRHQVSRRFAAVDMPNLWQPHVRDVSPNRAMPDAGGAGGCAHCLQSGRRKWATNLAQ